MFKCFIYVSTPSSTMRAMLTIANGCWLKTVQYQKESWIEELKWNNDGNTVLVIVAVYCAFPEWIFVKPMDQILNYDR